MKEEEYFQHLLWSQQHLDTKSSRILQEKKTNNPHKHGHKIINEILAN